MLKKTYSKPQLSILNDTDMRHYQFVRDSKVPRGSFRTEWDEVGHRLAPVVVIVGLLAGLLAVWWGS